MAAKFPLPQSRIVLRDAAMSLIIDTDGLIYAKLDEIIQQQKAIVELQANVLALLKTLLPVSEGIDIHHAAVIDQPMPSKPGP
jgi:hypothetical protein